METEAETGLHEGGYLHASHDGDGERRADGEQEQARLAAQRAHEGVREEGHDDDEVHEDRADCRPEVLALCVEKAAEDGAHTVEDDLKCEEAEEPDGVLDGLARTRTEKRLREHDLRREERGKQCDDAEEDEGKREQVGCVAIALLA